MATFYLKYRPQSLTDLIGQEEVKKVLLTAYQAKKLAHAYLFVGPRGSGKTSTARILAKMVNCLGKEDIPCNECANCLSISDGSSMDLIEIDAASNRGIEDIRALREKIKLAPSTLNKKVYIIDEAHMLTPEAFNALLKTLEEPPSHALFILATTEVGKLPQTILSRVQRVDFKLGTPEQILTVLQKVLKEEKIDIDEPSLKLLVKRAEGSFRDGVKLLDQVSTLGKITTEVLEKILNSSKFEEVLNFLENLAKKDTKVCLSWVSKQLETGTDIKNLTISLMDILRNLMLIKNGLGSQLVEPNLMAEDYQSLIKLAGNFTNKDLVNNLDFLQKALEKSKTISIASLPLEVAVVEMCGEDTKMRDDRSLKLAVENPPNVQTPTSNDDIILLKEKWTFVLETIRPFNFSLEALLRSINVTECTKTEVFMEVPYSFHQRILEAPKNRDLLESIFSEILGRGVKISTVLGNRPARTEDIANIEVAADDEIIRAAAEIFNSDSIN